MSRRRIVVQSPSGLITFRDAAMAFPTGTTVAGTTADLTVRSREAGLFLLEIDPDVQLHVDVVIEDTASPQVEPGLTPVAGSFLLRAPSARIAASAVESWRADDPSVTVFPVPGSGDYQVRVEMPPPFDAARHAAEMTALLGAADWRYRVRVDRLGLLGCLPTAIAVGMGVLGAWTLLLRWGLALAALSWVPYAALRRGARYRRIEERALHHERAKPHMLIRLRPWAGGPLEGGILRVDPR